MSEADKNKRMALEKLEELVRAAMESCEGNVIDFELAIPEDFFSPEEISEICHMIPKLQKNVYYLKEFCALHDIGYN